jgi:hypothetical protein
LFNAATANQRLKLPTMVPELLVRVPRADVLEPRVRVYELVMKLPTVRLKVPLIVLDALRVTPFGLLIMTDWPLGTVKGNSGPVVCGTLPLYSMGAKAPYANVPVPKLKVALPLMDKVPLTVVAPPSVFTPLPLNVRFPYVRGAMVWFVPEYSTVLVDPSVVVVKFDGKEPPTTNAAPLDTLSVPPALLRLNELVPRSNVPLVTLTFPDTATLDERANIPVGLFTTRFPNVALPDVEALETV